MTHEFICRQCNTLKTHEGGCSTGYGEDSQGNKICFECCGKQDRGEMLRTGRATLYLSGGTARFYGEKITNWPGSLEFKASLVKKGHHNIAGSRYDVWFHGPDNHLWHGVQYGENTQLLHCQRTKQIYR